MAWFNADGLNIKHGRENVRDNGIVASIKTFGSEGELQIKFDLATMTAGTQFTTDRDNDDTLDGFNIGDVHLPDGAVIESAAIYMTDEAAAGGTIGLVEDGDIIEINIPERSINVKLTSEELATRRTAMDAKGDMAWQPVDPRPRKVSAALKVYAKMATSADKGAVRDLSLLD